MSFIKFAFLLGVMSFMIAITFSASPWLRRHILCPLEGHNWKTYPAGTDWADGKVRVATARKCLLGEHWDPLVWGEWKEPVADPVIPGLWRPPSELDPAQRPDLFKR